MLRLLTQGSSRLSGRLLEAPARPSRVYSRMPSSDDDSLGFFTRPPPASLLAETQRTKRASSDASARRPAPGASTSRTPSVDLTGLDSDEDDGDDSVRVTAVKGKGKARAPAVARLASPSSDEEDDETIPIDSPYTLDALVGVPRRSSSLRKTVLARNNDYDLPPPLDLGRPKPAPAPAPIAEEEVDERDSPPPPRQREASGTTTDSDDRPILETIARRQQRKAAAAGPSQRRCDQCGNMLDAADYQLHIDLHRDADDGAFDVDPDEIEALESPPAQPRKPPAPAARTGLAERRERDHAQLADGLRLREVPRKRPAAMSIVLDDDDDDEPVIVAPAKRARTFVPNGGGAAAKSAPRVAPAAPVAGPSRQKAQALTRPNAAGPFAAMAAKRAPAPRLGPIEIDDDDDDEALGGGDDGYVSDTAPGTMFLDRINDSAREHCPSLLADVDLTTADMSAAGIGNGADPEASREEWNEILQRQRDPPKAPKPPAKTWGGSWRGARGGRARGRGGARGGRGRRR